MLFLISLAQAATVVAIVDDSTSATSADLAAQLNDDTYYDFTATVVSSADVDTASELSAYEVVILGDSGSDNQSWDSTFAIALSTWVDGGGAVVGVGWLDYAIRTGAEDAYLDLVLPIDADNSDNYDYCSSNATISLSSTSHDITDGVASSFTLPKSNNVEYSSYAPDATNGVVLGTVSASSCSASSGGNHNALVAGEYGSGRIVYLGLIYMAHSGYDNGDLRTGAPDRLLEQAVAWSSGGDSDEDGYEGSEDCDDSDATVYPGATELCDGQLNDCDGAIGSDEADDDSDGFVECTIDSDGWDGSAISGGDDCDDDDASIYPGAEEVAYDGIDQNCDTYDLCDVDGDGFDYDGAECFGDDCDDADEAINVGADEIWYDDVDQNCDEASDYDADGDGHDSDSYGGDDCDDNNPETYPGAPDEVGDGVINDCDDSDEYDGDGDGFDGADYGGTDCDDANSGINPDAEEIWYDGVDQNCDGNDDDQDGDGWPTADDCDDTDPDLYDNCGGGDTGLDGGGGCGKSSTAPVPASLVLALLGLSAGLRRRRG